MVDISIGKLAALTGVKVPTIRFYEQNNLIPLPCRTEGGQRRYDESAVRRLNFIHHARDLGFSVEDIRQLLALSEHPALSCETAEEIARYHLQQVEEKVARLRRIRSELKRMIEACGGGSVAECRILDALSKGPANDASTPSKPGVWRTAGAQPSPRGPARRGYVRRA
jgi:DNA-binding transcriptional MerR regulator